MEETGPGGERIGQYSYIDQNGKTITVKYSAGKDGFKILEGNHVPNGANGQNSAAHDPNYREPDYKQQQAYQYNQQQQSSFNYNNNNNNVNYNYQPTEASRSNFFPPGKLNLNRFETGFNFDFESWK